MNEILKAILLGFESAFKKLKSYLDILRFTKRSEDYLKQEALERRIFPSWFETDSELRNLIKEYLDIHQKRGTEEDLKDELGRITRNEVFVREASGIFEIDFSIIFRYDTATQYVLDIGLDTIYMDTLTGGIFWFAVDRRRKYYFVSENSVLKRRSLIDGILEATEFESVGAQKVLFVDAEGFLWTIDNTPNKYVRKWSPDLQSRTDYALKSGNLLNDKIYHLCLTYDNRYLYVTGGTNRNILARYTIDNLNGGDPEWYRDFADDYFNYVTVDENGDVFVTGHPYGGATWYIFKFRSDGNWGWPPSGGYMWRYGGPFISYCRENGMLYAPGSPYEENVKFFQYRGNDGSLIAKTVSCGAGAYCCSVYNQNTLICGCTIDRGNDTAIKKYSISDNWINGVEDYTSQRQITTNKYHIFAGDPIGYLHKCMIDESDSEGGWWLDLTYPEIAHGQYYDENALSGPLGCEDIVLIQYSNWNPKYLETKIKEIIARHLVPLHISYVLENYIDPEILPMFYKELMPEGIFS